MKQGRRSGRGCVAALSAGALLLAGCGFGAEEPGLFGRSAPPTVPPTLPAVRTSAPVATPVPVAGDAVWTSGEGQQIQIRLAVHAVRRMRGATVLDWSVTPLGGPGLRPGEPVPGVVNLGLTRLGEDNANVFLLDGEAERLYRPLTTRGFAGLPSCLCSPVRLAERHLVVGQTQLMQIAYPPLPADLAAVDVDIATVPIFWHVPVTGRGQVPTVTNPVDLTVAAAHLASSWESPAFSYGPGGQRFTVSVDEVVAGSTYTSLGWTIRSLTAGEGLDSASAPPLATQPRLDTSRGNPVTASGPTLQIPGRRERLRALLAASGPPPGPTECLCSDLRVWTASMARAGQQVSVVTNFAPLPRETQRVDVRLPGLPPWIDVAVTRASDGAWRSGPGTTHRGGTWTYSEANPPSGWLVDQWPTPLPDPSQLSRYHGRVDSLASR